MARLEKRKYDDHHLQPRGWGYEVWIENIPEYCGKVLTVRKGLRGSLHFHLNKLETMFLTRGHVKLRFIDADNGGEYYVELFPGESVKIPRGQVHQIIALEESDIVEFSTIHEESDSYRIQKGD